MSFRRLPGINRRSQLHVRRQGHEKEGVTRPDELRRALGGPRGGRGCEEAEGGQEGTPALADGGPAQDATGAGMAEPLRRGCCGKAGCRHLQLFSVSLGTD